MSRRQLPGQLTLADAVAPPAKRKRARAKTAKPPVEPPQPKPRKRWRDTLVELEEPIVIRAGETLHLACAAACGHHLTLCQEWFWAGPSDELDRYGMCSWCADASDEPVRWYRQKLEVRSARARYLLERSARYDPVPEKIAWDLDFALWHCTEIADVIEALEQATQDAIAYVTEDAS